ncbi:hypothetical protein [Pseudoalteromonas phage PH357]|nr:hypothetical protein [Pseudoalteromonas phage PH357]
MKKIETVVNMSLSRTSRGNIRFSVEDEHSSDFILEVNMSTEDFALLVTGLGGIKSKAEVYPEANIAKKREIKSVTCEKTWEKDVQREIVQKDFEDKGYSEEGWEIHDNGLRSQQYGKEHKYSLKRYVPVEDVYDIERYY